MSPDMSYFAASSSRPSSRPSTPPAQAHDISDAPQSGPSSSTDTTETNTLVITQLPRELFEPSVLHALREHFASYGGLYAWAPLRSFARIVLVYYDPADAETAKQACDYLHIEPTQYSSGMTLRVYRADPTPIQSPNADVYLHPPVQERNFLISPPGSPPVGWEPVREDPPNAAPLADDLIAALRKLELQQRGGGREVLLEPVEGVGIGVYVEDCADEEAEGEDPEMDFEVEEGWAYGAPVPRQSWRPVPTALPPMRVGA